MILHDVFTLPSSEQPPYWSYNLHVAENPSNQSKTLCALHPGTKSADIHIRGSTENPHRRLARLLRKIVKSMALQLLNLLCPVSSTRCVRL